MFYDGYYFFGMHLIWWIIWLFLLLWLYVRPYIIQGENKKKESPLCILNRRLARGQITVREYLKGKKVIDNNEIQ
jgi:putative membrane protein